MARHDGASDLEDRTTGPDRLQSMRLRPQPPGWVPEPAAEALVRQPAPPGPPEAVVSTPTPTSVGELARGWAQDRLPVWAHGLLDRLSLGSLVSGIAVVVIVGVLGAMLLHHRAGGTTTASYGGSAAGGFSGSSYASSPVVSAAPSPAAAATSIVVDVGGRVRKPGLVTLPPGARVADAIAAAGGPLRHREIALLDLAARVTDGQLLLIGVNAGSPATGAPSAGDPSTATSAAPPVSLSTATLEGLETLPGVGPVTAQKIIDFRTAHSGFTSVAQLQQVSGIGPATYAELAPLVTP